MGEDVAEKSILASVKTKSPGVLELLDFIDSLPFYVMLTDEAHNILTANKAVRDTFGFDPETIVGQFCPKAIHGLNNPYPGCPLEEAAKENRSVEKEMFFPEYQKWFRSAAYLTDKRTDDGNRIFVHMIHDINERKEAEAKLNAKIDELEKWQRLTTGREIRMAELKQEIKDLREKLKDPLP
jgi:PAS domain S-box-containing protein